MKESEVFQMLKDSGFPVAYDHFEEGQEPEKPYAIYRYPGTNNFSGDGAVYQEINKLDIELYTEKKDKKAEKKMEAVLKKHSFFYEKTEAYISTEKMYEVLYEMEVLIHEE